ncbi:hypothetical protein A3K86_02510 [Photobacterium jeanii]|uniref:Metallopeptidase n=1 Tax=Photobacterium jeanii TaxID=858640 RepID=A0A178KKN5_9GAMM|nr:DUF4344 domain-containing metallopeptidase [Photobacterium jeanii]OAN17811.1 hypothetical protein A3K86_02510 [Photobacterium jeanii]PST92523.1 hypothetical protein C9I91_04960 [Photobacterium jeanii]
MKWIHTTLSSYFIIFLLSFSFSAQAKIALKFEKTESDIPEFFLNDIKTLSQDFIEFANYLAPIKQDVTLQWADNIDGPLFDPETNTIQMPYHFAGETFTLFDDDNYDKTGRTALQATLDAIQFILFHEYGHAYLHNYQIITLGKEEDAVDNLATILLLYFNDDGAEIAISAADWFAIADEQNESLDEGHFWDEHSLDAQRYYAIQCLVFGSDIDAFRDNFTKEQLEEERDTACEYEHYRQLTAWITLIAKHSHNMTAEQLFTQLDQEAEAETGSSQ